MPTKKPAAKPTKVEAERRKPSRFSFAATLQNVKIQPAKVQEVKGQYPTRVRGRTMTGGAIELTILVERPQLPKAPVKKDLQSWQNGRQTNRKPGKEPPPFVEPPAWEATKDGKPNPEAKKDYDGRTKEARSEHKRDHDEWAAQVVAYNGWLQKVEANDAAFAETMSQHRRRIEKIGEQFAGFGSLAGMGSLLVGIPFDVTMTPNAAAVRKYLPGFSPSALVGGDARQLQLTGPSDDSVFDDEVVDDLDDDEDDADEEDEE